MISHLLRETSAGELAWIAVGILAQLMFSARFLVQWIASERVRRSVVPEAFWYFSLAGGALLLSYAVYRLDPVFMLGQGFGLLVYVRNIQLIRKARRDGTGQGGGAAGGGLPADAG